MSSAQAPVPLGLIVNTKARAVKRRYLSRPFWRACLSDELVRLTADLGELDDAVSAFREVDARAVAVLGGDGSVHHFVDALIRHYGEDAPPVLALAGGTLNGVSRALGTGGPPQRVLAAALSALASEPPPVRSRHVLRVVDHRTGRSLHGFGFVTGLVYRIYERHYRHPDPGLARAVRSSLIPVTAAIFERSFYEGIRLEVEIEGVSLAEPPHTVLASVLDNPLLWFRPFGEPLGDADAFHFGVTSMRPRELVPRLWRVMRGTCRHPRLRTGRTREATVRGNVGYIIDGDMYPGDSSVDVKLTLGPRLRFLVPSRPSAAAPRPEAPI